MTYRIVDEPSPTGLARWVVRPFWPLFAQLGAGAWLAWPWFIVNSIAMGSATRRREAMWIGAAAAASTLVALAVVATGVVNERTEPYVLLAMTTLKLGFAYGVLALQERTFGLAEHFGRRPRAALWVVLGGVMLRGIFLSDAPLFVVLVLS